MYYDQDGDMKAAGAEADGASVLAQAEDEGWIKTELYVCATRPVVCGTDETTQVQASLAPKDNGSQNERHAPVTATTTQECRRRLWRLPVISLPMHALVHRRHARKRSCPVARR